MIILASIIAYLLVGFLIASIVFKSPYLREEDSLLFLPMVLFWPYLIAIFIVIWLVAPVVGILTKYIKWLKSSKKNSATAEGEW